MTKLSLAISHPPNNAFQPTSLTPLKVGVRLLAALK